jgi:hypothetical protein
MVLGITRDLLFLSNLSLFYKFLLNLGIYRYCNIFLFHVCKYSIKQFINNIKMSDKKTLTINPDLFSFSNNTTRKKRSTANSSGIKIKTSAAKTKDDTLKKRSILKMIRQHQEDRYKKLFEDNSTSKNAKTTPVDNQFNKEFQEAKAFLENLTEKKTVEQNLKNHTLKNYPNNNPTSLLFSPSVDSLAPMQLNDIISTNVNNVPSMKINTLQTPKYGCLKNGELPTYRNYLNQTRKNIQQPIITIGGNINSSNTNKNTTQSININTPTTNPFDHSLLFNQNGGNNSQHVENKINDAIDRVKQMNQAAIKLQELKKQMRPKKMKQKKTKRRTYKIGKSKILPKVSVLVSNKTIRNNISTKKQLLKQVPIQEVKSYLMKRGFIKVGSTAPSDVLRKMYESAVMICGEVQNHNPDNLLYNYLNGGDT